ncbi:MAG: hypothetical protein PHH44_03420 [bacterium]|jgi:hypothetical protein|nr:hypothetical protein [bacterium]
MKNTKISNKLLLILLMILCIPSFLLARGKVILEKDLASEMLRVASLGYSALDLENMGCDAEGVYDLRNVEVVNYYSEGILIIISHEVYNNTYCMPLAVIRTDKKFKIGQRLSGFAVFKEIKEFHNSTDDIKYLPVYEILPNNK